VLQRRERRSRYVKPPDISGWVLVGGLVGFVAVIYLFTRNGCDNEVAGLFRLRMVKVNTWERWREHLTGTDLYLKYGAFNVSYEPDSIRSDFARHLPLFVFKKTFASPPRIWNERTTLLIASLTNEPDFGTVKTFFEELAKREWTDLPEEEYFIHLTIASLFQEAVVQGPDDQTARIRLPFIYGE
jgi:hypothetical protein